MFSSLSLSLSFRCSKASLSLFLGVFVLSLNALASAEPYRAVYAEKLAFKAFQKADYCEAGNFFFAASLALDPSGKDNNANKLRQNAVLAFEKAQDFVRAGSSLGYGQKKRSKKLKKKLAYYAEEGKSQPEICRAPVEEERGRLSLIEHLSYRQQLSEQYRVAFFKPSFAKRRGDAQTQAFQLPLQDSSILGPRKAPHTLVVFSDFQCPFCARLHPLFNQVLKDPELKNEVKIVFKEFPLGFHKDALPAAKAALAAGKQGDAFYYRMAEKLFENQRELTSENFSIWAKEIGLDVSRFEKDFRDKNRSLRNHIKADQRLAKQVQVRGTPSLFLDGWAVTGARDLAKLKAMLREHPMSGKAASTGFERVLTH